MTKRRSDRSTPFTPALWKIVGGVCLFWLVAAMASPAQSFSTLVNFNLTDGALPNNLTLVQGVDGDLYGVTDVGGTGKSCGAGGCGTVFKISQAGVLTTLHNFNTTDGKLPGNGGLTQASDGNFYGTTGAGGANGKGTIFKLTPQGHLTSLYSFHGTDGSSPFGTLVQATDGNFYGTTYFGGTSGNCSGGCGTVFRITPKGVLTTLYNFQGPDGQSPTGVIQATDGNFYGSTIYGGIYLSPDCADGTATEVPCGTVFKITAKGTLTTLHSFNGTDGFIPNGLVQANDGNFYGTTYGGGSRGGAEGTIFKIAAGGTFATILDFDNSDGYAPYCSLVQGTDGAFYGTTTSGGDHSSLGTIFRITAGGTLTTLHTFAASDGYNPTGTLVQATSGSFYGTVPLGGGNGDGTLFLVDLGLGPFVATRPASGKVGASVTILGDDLTGSTGVSFNGTAATFTVVSSTEIRATVPTGATAGKITVTTADGILKSNAAFRVTH